MAGKRVNSKDCSFDHVHYNVETHTLYFRSKSGGAGVMFLGVPPELFYGMPSGANLENFIAIKLSGRFSRVDIPPPPSIWYSRINNTCYMQKGTTTYVYRTRSGEPTSMPDNAEEAFKLFLATYANRDHDETTEGKAIEANDEV